MVFNIYYQWLDIFNDFWIQQFSETKIANHNKLDYEGFGGDVGILLSGFVRMGVGAHLMNERKITRESTNPYTGEHERFNLTISGRGCQVFGVVFLDLSNVIGIEAGAGYYWSDYRIKDITNGVISTRIWKSDGPYAIAGLAIAFENLKIYAEGNLVTKSKKTFAFLYKRVGLRWAIPIKKHY